MGETLWRGRSSQLLHLPFYLACLLTCWLVVPIFMAAWRWLELRCRSYELDGEKLQLSQGVFSRRTDILELYRVRDITVVQPLLLRIFSLAHIVLATSDSTTPRLVIEAVPDFDKLKETLRAQVERCRDQKRVRQFDVDVEAA